MGTPRLRLAALTLILGLLVACAAQAGYYADQVMGDSPAAYWRLNEASGTGISDSAGTHNGTVSGTHTKSVPGALAGTGDTAMNFAGGMVTIPYSDDFDGTTFSVECWARELVGPGSWRAPQMFRWVDSPVGGITPCYGYNLYADATHDNWEFWIGQGTAANSFAVVNGPAVDRGEWTHLLGTYDGTTMRFYVDGRLVSQANRAHGVHRNPTQAFNIAGGPRFYGDLDEVAVYQQALAPERVAAHYVAGVGMPAADVLCLHLDEGAGGQARDSVHPNPSVGTLNGPTWTAGKFGPCLQFDDPGDNVYFANGRAGSYPQLSFEAWVNLGDKEGRNELFCEQSNNSLWVNFDTNGADKLDVYLGDTTVVGYHSTNAAIPRGEWTHVAFTYDDEVDELKLYINGMLDRTATTSGTINLDSTMMLGKRESGSPGTSFEGLADEIALYSYVLSDLEIFARYGAGPPLAVPEPTTMALLGLGSAWLAARRRRRRRPHCG